MTLSFKFFKLYLQINSQNFGPLLHGPIIDFSPLVLARISYHFLLLPHMSPKLATSVVNCLCIQGKLRMNSVSRGTW